MYLTETQLQQILTNSYYTDFVTQSVVDYAMYRGHLSATVHTLRFNVGHANHTLDNVMQHIVTHLMTSYDLNTQLLGSVSFDLLLTHQPDKTFYIWRANSNSSSRFQNETFMPLTYNNVYRFVTNALNVHIPDLNIFFRNSTVTVERVLAIVFSFVTI